MKKVIVSSFHTCSPYALADENDDVDAIVSFDSHIDIAMVGFRGEVIKSIESDWPMRYTAGRASAHLVFWRIFDIADLFLLAPEVCIETEVAYKQVEMAKQFPEQHHKGLGENWYQEYRSFLKGVWNIDLIKSPPKDPLTEAKKISNSYDSLAFDIDVDYFGSMQEECYTPMRGATPTDLGNLDRVTKLIKKIRPEIITISEATVTGLNNPNSKINEFLRKLVNIGYSREDYFLFDNDDKAIYNLRKWENFEKYWKDNKKHPRDLQNLMDEESSNELEVLAKEYFKHT